MPETNATFAITIRKEIAKAFLSAVYLLKCKLAFQILDDKRFLVIRRRYETWREPKLKVWCKTVSENLSRLIPTSSCTIMMTLFFQNKGAPMRTMEDLENTTRDAIDIDMSHPTRLLSRDPGSSKENYDASKYEREASKQQR